MLGKVAELQQKVTSATRAPEVAFNHATAAHAMSLYVIICHVMTYNDMVLL